MSYKGYVDFFKFLKANENRVFRMWRYKKHWTPYEAECCNELTTCYEDDECAFVVIREAMAMPNCDVLLGVEYIEGEDCLGDECEYLEYFKLSEIMLAYASSDQFDKTK